MGSGRSLRTARSVLIASYKSIDIGTRFVGMVWLAILEAWCALLCKRGKRLGMVGALERGYLESGCDIERRIGRVFEQLVDRKLCVLHRHGSLCCDTSRECNCLVYALVVGRHEVDESDAMGLGGVDGVTSEQVLLGQSWANGEWPRERATITGNDADIDMRVSNER